MPKPFPLKTREDRKLARLAIKAVAALMRAGRSEYGACVAVSKMLGKSSSAIYWVWKLTRDRIKAQAVRPKMAKVCVYCGLRFVPTWRDKLVQVCDWRGVVVWAHYRCEVYEQCLTGAL